MKRRHFLGGVATLSAVAVLPADLVKGTGKSNPSRWLRALEHNQDYEALKFWATSQEEHDPRIVDLDGAMLSIIVIDQMLSSLSGDVSIELFPKHPWRGCHILSVPFHLSTYMAMRYELTAEKDNAELDRAHEGAIWTLDHRIPNDVILFEAANGKIGLARRAYNQ